MKKFLSEKIIHLSNICPSPLYVVGGAVRDFLIDGSFSKDIDLTSALSVEEISALSTSVGLQIIATYPRTNTAVLFDGERKYEYTAFRKDIYADGGSHKPLYTEYTLDIKEDALRRDFKCNAIYFDIKNDKIEDVLGGREDISNKIISAVKSPNEVFSHDGLRLMRLARFCGELGFSIEENTLLGAKNNAEKIKDISAERIYDELTKMLVADEKHRFSPKNAHYVCIKALEEIGVLKIIMPELCLGKGMEQRKDYHKFDVLEHSLKTLLYADKSVRLSALLHDVGKPFCQRRDNNFYLHPVEGQKIAKNILERLKVPTKEIEKTCFLIKEHMVDIDLSMRKSKVRKFIVKNYQYLELLFHLKQADFMGSKEQGGEASTIEKWRKILDEMKADNTPFSIKELKISAKELMEIGFLGKEIGKEIEALFNLCIDNPEKNQKEELIKQAKRHYSAK